MRKRWKQLAVATLLSFLLLAPTAAHAETIPETRAASVLFQQFETVAYTRSDLLYRYVVHDSSEVDSEEDLALPFLELLGGLKVLGPKAETDLKRSYGVVLGGAKDSGARDVAQPTGLGMIGSHNCYIGILQRDAKPNLGADFSRAFHITIDGRPVWTWTTPRSTEETKTHTFYAAQVAGAYLVIANNRQDLRRVARALASAPNAKSEAIHVFGWKNFSAHPFWVYRQIRRRRVSSPDAAGLRGLSSDVVALTFFADVEKRESFLQVLSSDTTMKTAPKVIPDRGNDRLQPRGGGVWQAAIPLSKDEAGFDDLFRIFYRFGFSVLL